MSHDTSSWLLVWLLPLAIFGFVTWRTGPFLLQTCGIDLSKEPATPSDGSEETPAPSEVREAYADTACSNLLDCFGRESLFGQVTVEVSAIVVADGHLTDPEVRGAPSAVAECMEREMRSRKLEGYGDGGGEVHCRFTGTYMEGAQMVAHGHSYAPRSDTGGAE
ncbi:MAG: hypothetical protein ACODAU_02075 [Myxococcota bacterium]